MGSNGWVASARYIRVIDDKSHPTLEENGEKETLLYAHVSELKVSAGIMQIPVLEHLQWNLWNWSMISALKLDNILEAVPLHMQLDF